MFQLLIEWQMECLTCFWGVGFFTAFCGLIFKVCIRSHPAIRSLYFSTAAGSQLSWATSLASASDGRLICRPPGVNWRPDDIFKESPYSVFSSTIASGVVKRTRTFHASDRQDMGAESAAAFTTKVPWELQDVLPRMQLTPRVAKLLDPFASVPSSPAKPLPNPLSKFDFLPAFCLIVFELAWSHVLHNVLYAPSGPSPCASHCLVSSLQLRNAINGLRKLRFPGVML